MNTHVISDFLSKQVGGHFLCGPHRAGKWGDASPRPPPIYAHGSVRLLENRRGDEILGENKDGNYCDGRVKEKVWF